MYIGLPSESDEANDVPETEDADRSTDLDPDSRSLGSKSSDRSKLTIEPVYAGLFEAIASSMASWFDLSVTELELNDNLLKNLRRRKFYVVAEASDWSPVCLASITLRPKRPASRFSIHFFGG